MPKTREHLLYCVRARALLVVDAFFNIREPKGVGAWLILKMFGTYDRFGMSKLFLAGVQDKAAFIASLEPLAKLDIAVVVPAHGSILDHDAKAMVMSVLRERKLGIDLG